MKKEYGCLASAPSAHHALVIVQLKRNEIISAGKAIKDAPLDQNFKCRLFLTCIFDILKRYRTAAMQVIADRELFESFVDVHQKALREIYKIPEPVKPQAPIASASASMFAPPPSSASQAPTTEQCLIM